MTTTRWWGTNTVSAVSPSALQSLLELTTSKLHRCYKTVSSVVPTVVATGQCRIRSCCSHLEWTTLRSNNCFLGSDSPFALFQQTPRFFYLSSSAACHSKQVLVVLGLYFQPSRLNLVTSTLTPSPSPTPTPMPMPTPPQSHRPL
ncbi:Hypothetical protein CINCED_3A001053 [Cinara cedri]|uniref:Uncharacterized protein n=1 Tax=Cinara cedri TaxID=506608 RepID=A0A5E4MFK2_9HEMI|nr:Hypothetical protein CINCED_3A001053 [Cinara cedri]